MFTSSVAAAEPTGRSETTHPLPASTKKIVSKVHMLKLNFVKIRNRCVQMASFSTALGTTELCSFCPQWERHGVQYLVRLVWWSSAPPLHPSVWLQVSPVSVEHWMVGENKFVVRRTWICVVPEKRLS